MKIVFIVLVTGLLSGCVVGLTVSSGHKATPQHDFDDGGIGGTGTRPVF